MKQTQVPKGPLSFLKKAILSVLAAALAFGVGLFAFAMFQMYKPVLDASKPIPEVDGCAMRISDELLPREVKLIGLGEATHGNKEFQELKLDVLKTLIRDNGVSAVCLEMDYGEGVLVNDYITGRSEMTSEELFSHISFEIYHTEEIKALIEWLKAYNEESRDGVLEFYGFDIQNPEVDIYVIREFAKSHDIPLRTEALNALLAGEFRFKDQQAEEVFGALSELRETLMDESYGEYDGIDRILKCIDNVFLSKELAAIPLTDSVGYGTYRDKAMAENAKEIYERVGYPILLAGHNGHVGYAGSYVKTMGAYLKEMFGDDYYVIGTDYFKTTASIKSDKGRKNCTSYSGDPLAYQAKRLGTYYLRFADLTENETLYSLITGKMSTGSLGEGFNFMNRLFAASVRVYAPVTELYDAMIFVYEATPFTTLS